MTSRNVDQLSAGLLGRGCCDFVPHSMACPTFLAARYHWIQPYRGLMVKTPYSAGRMIAAFATPVYTGVSRCPPHRSTVSPCRFTMEFLDVWKVKVMLLLGCCSVEALLDAAGA